MTTLLSSPGHLGTNWYRYAIRYYLVPHMSKGRPIAATPRATEESARDDAPSLRQRIVAAAFAAFRDKGYAATTTLEIATRARVSKRELYALVGNKQQLL